MELPEEQATFPIARGQDVDSLVQPAHHHIDAEEVKNTSKESATFIGLRYGSNALWLGGTAIGIYAQRKYGLDPAATMAAVGLSVGATEFAGTEFAVKAFDHGGKDVDLDGPKEKLSSRMLKNVVALGYTAWSGAMSAVKVNNSLGLESTRKRRIVQSAVYGAAVSLWSLPIMQDVAIEAGEEVLDNPVEWLSGGAVGSLVVYGVVKATQVARHRRRIKKQQEPGTETEQS